MTSVVGRFLRVPIFYKVFLGNSLIVVAVVVAGACLAAEHARAHPEESYADTVALFVLAGLAVSTLVNFVIVRVALLPWQALARTVDRVRRGDLQARATRVKVGDPQVDELVATLNAMLDEVQAYREEVRRLSSQAISAQEEERKRVARELHDETAQSLTSLLVRLRIAERAGSVEDVRAAVAEARELTARTLDEVRKLALELRPSALDDLGLVPALQWYTKEYASRHGVPIDFRTKGLDERLPPGLELVFYRVIQEALTNVAKHAEARQVHVWLERRDGVVRGVIRDDGRGFDVAATLQSRERGLGLFGMQERLALVGGRLGVDSAKGAGTAIHVEVPVEENVRPSGRAEFPVDAAGEAMGQAGGGVVERG